MNASAMELRVLSGIHRRSNAPIADGALIGADPACDVVLADAGISPRMARLSITAKFWTLIPEACEQNLTPADMWEFNQPGRLGPIWVTLTDPAAPWIDAPPEEIGDGSQETSYTRAEAGALPPVDAAAMAHVPTLPTPVRPGKVALYLYGGIVSMLLLCVSGAAYLMQPLPHLPQSNPQQQVIDGSLPEINRILKAQNLSDRLTVGRRADHSIIITGWLRDPAEQETLSAAIAKVWPMPALQVTNEVDMLASARRVLKSYPLRYQASYQGSGIVAVRGIALDEEGRARAGDALRAALPGLRFNLEAVVLADEAAAQLAAAAAKAGLPELSLVWNGDRLNVAALEDRTKMQTLVSIIEAFNAAHLQIAVLETGSEKPAPKRAVATSVPFSIRSAMGGAQPFIVLGDGTKLTPGGVYRRYKLISIDNGVITFDGPTYAVVSR